MAAGSLHRPTHVIKLKRASYIATVTHPITMGDRWWVRFEDAVGGCPRIRRVALQPADSRLESPVSGRDVTNLSGKCPVRVVADYRCVLRVEY